MLSSQVAPSYTDNGVSGVTASFPASQIVLEVKRERGRAYPGLLSPAPSTDVIYRAFAVFTVGKSVLDVGSGAGSGLVHFEQAREICALDHAPLALAFAAQLVPHARFVERDATRSPLPQAEVAIVVDMLGQISEPLALLRAVGAAVGEGGLLLIAEAQASVAQELLAPVRAAFSKSQLLALLADAGFVVEEVLSEGSFLTLVTRRQGCAWSQGLEAADALLAEGLTEDAHRLLQRAPAHASGLAEASWFHRLGELERAAGHGDAAIAALFEAERRGPDDGRALATLSELLLEMGADSDAARFALSALERDAADGRALVALLRALGSNLECHQAVKLWSNAARLCPADIDVAVNFARSAAEQGAYAVGIRALERVREFHVALGADFHLTLGWLLVLTGRMSEAWMEVRMVQVLAPEHPGLDDLLVALCADEPVGQA